MKRLLSIFIFAGATALAFPTEYAFDSNKDGKPDKWYDYEDNRVKWEKSDLNFDGIVDYIVEFDEKGRKLSEREDSNFDGTFDTFFTYDQGKLVLEEIDSNYDGKIDLRVYMDGVYVLKYEQETDFDGIFDKTRMFGVK
jgi:hypothetical protein